MALANWHALRSVLRFTNREATRPDHPSPDLRTRFLAMEMPAAWRHVQACIESACGRGRRWRIEEESPASGQFHLTRRFLAFLFGGFTSDVKVNLWRTGEGRVGVDLSSASRVGRIDFGHNARTIRAFYRRLEGYLSASAVGSTAEGPESAEWEMTNAK